MCIYVSNDGTDFNDLGNKLSLISRKFQSNMSCLRIRFLGCFISHPINGLRWPMLREIKPLPAPSRKMHTPPHRMKVKQNGSVKYCFLSRSLHFSGGWLLPDTFLQAVRLADISRVSYLQEKRSAAAPWP